MKVMCIFLLIYHFTLVHRCGSVRSLACQCALCFLNDTLRAQNQNAVPYGIQYPIYSQCFMLKRSATVTTKKQIHIILSKVNYFKNKL